MTSCNLRKLIVTLGLRSAYPYAPISDKGIQAIPRATGYTNPPAAPKRTVAIVAPVPADAPPVPRPPVWRARGQAIAKAGGRKKRRNWCATLPLRHLKRWAIPRAIYAARPPYWESRETSDELIPLPFAI